MTHEEVRLEVPASPEYLRLARIMAAGVASRIGFTFDEVEDLRIAIDELCFSMVGPKGRAGSLRLRYVMLPDGLAVEGAAHFTDDAHPVPGLSNLSRQILSAVTDECELEPAHDGAAFRLVKRHPVG